MTQMLALVAVLWSSLAFAQAPAQQTPAGAPPTLQPNPRAPLYQHTGEQYRVYEFPGTGESIPYRLFVPSNPARRELDANRAKGERFVIDVHGEL